jgi:hypothetical protein
MCNVWTFNADTNMELNRDIFEGQISTKKDEYNLSPTRPFRTLSQKES